jgi:hypothetical protein
MLTPEVEHQHRVVRDRIEERRDEVVRPEVHVAERPGLHHPDRLRIAGSQPGDE